MEPVLPARDAPPSGGTETILFVEDEDAVRQVVCFILKKNGYQVLAAANGKEALSLWEKNKAKVALLLTDMMLPMGMRGVELASLLKAEAPQLKIIYASGYNAGMATDNLELIEGVNFVQKPFTSAQLLETIRRNLAG